MGQRRDWPGSKWWRIDLHAHSFASPDFRPRGRQGDSPNWTAWIEAARDTGLDAVAVTDHNTANGIEPLQLARSNVDGAPVLFPGVELTANDGTHLLIIWDHARGRSDVEAFLGRMQVRGAKRDHPEARSSLSIEDILSKCDDQVLVVGAHVNSSKGFLKHSGQQRITELNHPKLAAVEIGLIGEYDDGFLDGSHPEFTRDIPEVWGSDSHSIDRIGHRFTWVNLTSPNLEGIRLAALDGSNSLVPADEHDSHDPNSNFASFMIERITVYNGKFLAPKDPVTVRFNPWMNAIIGARGTGKSTLVDLMRKTLRRESELGERFDTGSLRDQFERRMTVSRSRRDEGLLTDESKVEIVYRKDESQFLLSWGQSGDPAPIQRLYGDKTAQEEGDVRERFPARIYSQKQLFELAQSPSALLAIIDDSEEVSGTEIRRSIQQKETEFLSIRSQARAAKELAGELPDRKAHLSDIRNKLKVLQDGNHAQSLRQYRKRRQMEALWKAVLEHAEELVEGVGSSVDDLLVSDFVLDSEQSNDSASANLRIMHQGLVKGISKLRKTGKDAVDQVRADIANIRSSTEARQWINAMQESASKFQEVAARPADEGIGERSEYTNLLSQATKLEREIKTLRDQEATVIQLESDSVGVLAECRDLRHQLSERRKQFVKRVTNELIRLEINAYSDHEDLEDCVIKAVATDRFEGDRNNIADRIRHPGGDVWDWDRLDSTVECLRQYAEGRAQNWEIRDRRFARVLNGLTPEGLDRLVLYSPEDTVVVRYRDKSGAKWKPLAQGSPGQQTAALLAFVLSYGSEPIILDQPEDDLANTLVYQLLVEQLRTTKNNRQVIVVTHNPNIVVHGDAEFILSLASVNRLSQVRCQGGL